MLGTTLYLTQATSDKNSLLQWCDGVCWEWQYVPAHGMTLLIYHLSSVSNLHLILGNLLLLVRLDVGPWPREPRPNAKALGAMSLDLGIKSLLTSLWTGHSILGGTISSLALEFC